MEIKLGSTKDIIMGGKELVEKEMPIKTSFKLSKALKIIEQEYNIFEEKRKKLIKKYAEKDEHGEIIQTDEGVTILNPEEFYSKLQELMDIEIEVDIKKFTIDELGSIDISPKTLLLLDPILQDVEVEDDENL